MKFVVDTMLGKLAKYLRFLGYDTLYFSEDRGDEYLLRLAAEENRIIITRDRELFHKARKIGIHAILIEHIELKMQLYQLKRTLNLDTSNMLSICSICNNPLKRISSKDAEGKVPQGVLERTEEFYICTGCGKIYWYGSHTADIERRLREVVEDEATERKG